MFKFLFYFSKNYTFAQACLFLSFIFKFAHPRGDTSPTFKFAHHGANYKGGGGQAPLYFLAIGTRQQGTTAPRNRPSGVWAYTWAASASRG